MPYKIQSETGYERVDLWGQATKWDVMQAIIELRRQDPCKAKPDLWVIDEEVVVPLADHASMADASTQQLPADFKGAPTAIVVNNMLQLEMAKLYREHLKSAPFALEIFQDIAAAEEWISSNTGHS